MVLLAAGWNQYLIGVLTVVFLLICVLMVLMVLIQKPQGGGLASAFGGSAASSGQTAFGAKTGDALTLITIGVFVLYLVIAMALNIGIRPITAAAGNDTASSATPVDGAVPADGAVPVDTDAPPTQPAIDPAITPDATTPVNPPVISPSTAPDVPAAEAPVPTP